MIQQKTRPTTPTVSQWAFFRSSLNRAHSRFCCMVSKTFQIIRILNPMRRVLVTIMAIIAHVGNERGQSKTKPGLNHVFSRTGGPHLPFSRWYLIRLSLRISYENINVQLSVRSLNWQILLFGSDSTRLTSVSSTSHWSHSNLDFLPLPNTLHWTQSLLFSHGKGQV